MPKRMSSAAWLRMSCTVAASVGSRASRVARTLARPSLRSEPGPLQPRAEAPNVLDLVLLIVLSCPLYGVTPYSPSVRPWRCLDNNRSYGLITIADAFETCQLGHRTDAATNQGVEAAAGSLDFLEQHRIGIGRPRVGCIDGEPHLHPAALDPVDYRLEQISSSGIGQQALPQALCLSR